MPTWAWVLIIVLLFFSSSAGSVTRGGSACSSRNASATDPAEGRTAEHRGRAESEKERRITALFRRWPSLNVSESHELRRLWDERIRHAKRGRW